MIPVLSDNLLYLFGQGIKVDTGIRISSFARNSKQAFYIAESKMRIPVLFYPSSILLYDNYDVSVTKFIIPKIKTMKDVFNKLNSLGLIEIENEADFFERYKLILKILDKEANQKNNKRKDK